MRMPERNPRIVSRRASRTRSRTSRSPWALSDASAIARREFTHPAFLIWGFTLDDGGNAVQQRLVFDFAPGRGGVIYASTKESRFPAYGFLVSTRDLARFGLLMEQDGRWEGQRIVPAAWIEESTKPHSNVSGTLGYAHLWWTDGSAFYASGTGGQRIYIDPASDLVIAVKVNTGQGLVSKGLWYFYGPDIGYTQFTELVALVNSAAPR